MEQTANTSRSCDYLPNDFVYQMLKNIRKFDALKKKENEFYNKLPYSEIKDRTLISIKKWYTYNLIRLMRIAYMYLNKNKYKVFTYCSIKFWQIASSKKMKNIEDIEEKIKLYDFNPEQMKYLKMAVNTFKKYDDSYGMFVACVVNRLFYHDLARKILYYI